MAAAMVRPGALSLSLFFLLLFSFSFTFPPPVASICVPRNSSSSHPAAPPPPPTNHTPPALTPTSAAPRNATTQTSTKPPPPSSSPKSPSSPPPHSSSPLHPASISNPVAALCAQTDYKDLCLSSTRSLIPAIGPVNAESLLRLVMKAIRSRTAQAKSKLDEAAADPEADPMVVSCLQACAEEYDDAASTLDEVEEALEAQDKASVNVKLTAVLDAFATCEEGFADSAIESPLEEEDEELQHLASNCLDLAELALK